MVAALGTFAFAPVAGAAEPPLIVDDDGEDCPAAPYTSIQNAIVAAAAGDTIAVCPGRTSRAAAGSARTA